MKKFGAIALSAAILSAMAVSASAAYIEQAADPATITFTIPQGYTAWAADGVISEGEYAKIDVKPEWISIAAASDEAAATAIQLPISLYMSYDANYVYVACETAADQYVCDIDDSNAGNMWAAHAIQLSFANIDATDSAERVELGYALSSLDNNLYAVSWFDPMGIAYDPDDAGDYTVVKTGNSLVYEMRVPFAAFEEKNLVEGNKFLGSVIWAMGTSEDGGSDAYVHEQLGYGVSGDPGKDPTGHATFTLGAALEAPVVEEPAVDAPAEGGATAPTTADAGIVAAAAVMAIAAGVVLSKKH
jgi:hypothetical protein